MSSDLPRWKRKSFWDGVAFWVGVVAAVLGGITTLAAPELKTWFAIPATIAGVIALAAAYVSKRCDDRDKSEKAKAEQAERKRYQDEIDRAKVGENAVRSEMTSLTRRAVKRVLESLKEDFFADGEEEERYKLRATLFRCVDGDDGTRRLVIYARAGANGSSTHEWEVVDDIPDRCEGIAGWIWGLSATKFVEAEGEWPAGADSDAKRRYVSRLRLSVEQAESLNVKSVGFGGTIVEVGGRRWGVLLLDTLKRGQFKEKPSGGKATTAQQRRAKEEYDDQVSCVERFARLIGLILLEEGAT